LREHGAHRGRCAVKSRNPWKQRTHVGCAGNARNVAFTYGIRNADGVSGARNADGVSGVRNADGVSGTRSGTRERTADAIRLAAVG